MCKTPKIPQADSTATRPAAPVEAVRALASPFEGLVAPGMSKLRIAPATSKVPSSMSPLTIPG